MNQLIASLLSALEREGRPVGPGVLLAIQQLLQQLPADTAPQTLKTLITPLLSSSPQEQERVYELFEEAIIQTAGIQYKGNHKNQKRVTDKKDTLAPLLKSLLLVLAIALCTALAGLGIWYFLQPDVRVSPAPQTAAAQPVPKDTFAQKPQIPQPADANPEIISHWNWIPWAYFALFVLVFISLWRYIIYRRRKLIAEQGRKNKPPYAWNIQIPGAEEEVITGAMYHHVLQVLRRRGATNLQLLDLTGTVKATAAKGGIPEFRYRSTTEPVDYLLLIDRQTYHNHRARFFDTLYRAFRDQEVDIHRFFYDSDIQVCFNEEHPYGIRIGELQQRHHNARLMVVGTGFQLLHPASGGLYAWTSVFALWKQRLLLTPRPLMQWGNNETQLSGLFTVLPATLQSLGFWLDELDSGQDLRFDNWREHIKDAPVAPVLPDENNPMTDLEQVYSKGMLQWIAACAIFPTIHWDLTLWLGRETGQLAGNTTASATDMLLHLFRLPWFVGGEIPTPARAALLQWFQQNNPALLDHLRTSLVDILSQNPPPVDAVAFDEYRMNLALQEWLVTKDAVRRKILEEEVARLLEAGHEADFTVIKELRCPGTPLDFEVPSAWRKYFYGNDIPGLGWKGLPRVIAKTSIVAALIAFWNTATWRLKKSVQKTTRLISNTSPRTKVIWVLGLLLILITSVFVIKNQIRYQFSEKVRKVEELKSRNMLKEAFEQIMEAGEIKANDTTAIKLRWEILKMALEQHERLLGFARQALQNNDSPAYPTIVDSLKSNQSNASILWGDDSTQYYLYWLSPLYADNTSNSVSDPAQGPNMNNNQLAIDKQKYEEALKNPMEAECAIFANVMKISPCNDKGTPDNDDDDTYTVDIKVSAAGKCSASRLWEDNKMPGAIGYDKSKTYVFKIKDGPQTIIVNDMGGSLTKFIKVSPPKPCSEQAIASPPQAFPALPPGINFQIEFDESIGNLDIYVEKNGEWVYGARRFSDEIGRWDNSNTGFLGPGKTAFERVNQLNNKQPGTYNVYVHYKKGASPSMKATLFISSQKANQFQRFESLINQTDQSPKNGGGQLLKTVVVKSDGSMTIF